MNVVIVRETEGKLAEYPKIVEIRSPPNITVMLLLYKENCGVVIEGDDKDENRTRGSHSSEWNEDLFRFPPPITVTLADNKDDGNSWIKLNQPAEGFLYIETNEHGSRRCTVEDVLWLIESGSLKK